MPKASALEAALAGLPQKLLVAVSGGIDSVSLLHALQSTGRKPAVVHFDHGWRSESSDDADFVREQARTLGLKFTVGKARKTKGRPREAKGRALRYAFFSRTAEKLGISDLVLAHQAEDQVETFLIQLLRGAGAGGCGMNSVTRRDGLILHRPWLGIWRKEIQEYARRHKLKWREDATNKDTRHRRNLLRQRVLPYLRRQISPQVAGNLWRAAEVARAEGEWLDSLCPEPGNIELDARNLRDAPVAQQRRVVLRWLQAREIRNLSFADVEAVRGLAKQMTPAKINLSAGKFARRRAGKIFIA